ncbi:MAG TPA: hypothetical protein VIO64_19710 [Pseudobacteroides sp.]|uniref:hypothetical protein n=1 Tax=Pseudobacteroides sp. TaxID=1968840 RepID=UPI002F944481
MGDLSLIKDIQQDKLSKEELIKCLDIPHNYVLSNTILKIVRKGIKEDEVIEKLAKLKIYMKKENKLFGIETVGHLAVAALFALNSEKSIKKYIEIMSELSECDKECIESIVKNKTFEV